jgi:hypothetical protein
VKSVSIDFLHEILFIVATFTTNKPFYLENNLTDNQLIEQIREGDSMAFEVLYRRYWKKLL